jgi:hypothetical protein
MEKTGQIKDSEYPSVELAYEFVKPSYDWMLSRIEAINSRIQMLLTFATTVTVAVPIFAKAVFDGIHFNSGGFYGAISCYVLLGISGIFGMRLGMVRLVHPMNLYRKWLHKSLWEFKKDTIYFAGEDFEDNKKLIDGKSHFRDIMTLFLLFEIVATIVWMVTAS